MISCSSVLDYVLDRKGDDVIGGENDGQFAAGYATFIYASENDGNAMNMVSKEMSSSFMP